VHVLAAGAALHRKEAMTDEELSADDLTDRERIVFVATCQLAEHESGDEREPIFYDPDYAVEAEHLVELGWLERVEHEGELLAGYRLSSWAAAAHSLQTLIEQAQASTN
jgi:hypothetical protein